MHTEFIHSSFQYTSLLDVLHRLHLTSTGTEDSYEICGRWLTKVKITYLVERMQQITSLVVLQLFWYVWCFLHAGINLAFLSFLQERKLEHVICIYTSPDLVYFEICLRSQWAVAYGNTYGLFFFTYMVNLHLHNVEYVILFLENGW